MVYKFTFMHEIFHNEHFSYLMIDSPMSMNPSEQRTVIVLPTLLSPDATSDPWMGGAGGGHVTRSHPGTLSDHAPV